MIITISQQKWSCRTQVLIYVFLISSQKCIYAVGTYSKCPKILNTLFHTFFTKFCFLCSCFSKYTVDWNGKQSRPQSDCSFRSSPILVCTVCIFHFVRNFGVQNFSTFTVVEAPLWSIFTSTHNICLCGKIRQISIFLGWWNKSSI